MVADGEVGEAGRAGLAGGCGDGEVVVGFGAGEGERARLFHQRIKNKIKFNNDGLWDL